MKKCAGGSFYAFGRFALMGVLGRRWVFREADWFEEMLSGSVPEARLFPGGAENSL